MHGFGFADDRLVATVRPGDDTWSGVGYNLAAQILDDEGVAATERLSTPVYIAGDANGEVDIFDAVAIGRNWQATAG